MSEKAKADGELLVMARLNRQLEALDPEARRRVVGWLFDRHYPRRGAGSGLITVDGTGNGACNAPRLGV